MLYKDMLYENKKKLLSILLVIGILVGTLVIVKYPVETWDGKANVKASITFEGIDFIGWVEIMSVNGEYLESQAKYTFNGNYQSLKEYYIGRILYVIAWIDLSYQIGDYLYVKGLRVAIDVQFDLVNIELSDGDVWFYPKNQTFP